MARIPDTELERLKREVSLERLAEARGVKLERRGADGTARAPSSAKAEPSTQATTAQVGGGDR